MAELEITYIPYGLDEISQLDLMTNLANGLPDFVKSYKWLLKPGITEKFLNAYKDIINHGITGASNSSGLWEITHNGDKIDTSTMSPIDKQIYEHAAYYIQLLMALMTPRKKVEEDAKKDLKDFNFVNDFNTSILNEYGGLQALFSDPEYGWNALDPRGANGLRGIDKRRDKVRDILQNYLDNYKDGQYNFEGTSFKSDADVRTKILNAINALDTIDNTTDDVEAFNALGLPYRTYFSNGGNDIYGTDPNTGQNVTYQLYAEYLNKINELKEKEELAKKQKLMNDSRGVLTYSSGNNPIDAIHNVEVYNNWINLKYGPQNGGMLAFDNRVRDLLEKSYNTGKGNGLTPLERKELGNMIHYIRTNNPKYQQYNLTPEDEGHLNAQDFPGLKGRKLLDFVRLPYQTSDGRYTYADKSGNIYFLKPKNKAKLTTTPTFDKNRILEYNNYIKGFGKSQEQLNLDLRNLDAKRTEINGNDVLYLSSLVPDIASLFDEEPISAGILGVTAAGMRNTALANRPGGMSLEDKLWLGLDYLGGAFSSVPFFGDAYVLGRIVNTARKAGTTLLAMAGAVGVSLDVYNLIKKLNNDETLTAREKIALASSIPLILLAYRSGRAWKQNKAIKAVNEGEKVELGTISATNGSIKGVKKETAKTLQKEFKKAGNDNAKKQEILKNNEEIVKLAKEQNVKIEDLQFKSHLRNEKHSPFKKQQDIKIEPTSTGNPVYRQNYQLYLRELENGNFWLRNKARGLKEADWLYNKTGGSRNNPTEGNWFKRIWNGTFGSNKILDRIQQGEPRTLNPESVSSNRTSSNSLSSTTQVEVPHSKNEIRADWKNTIERKQFTTNKIEAGDYVITNPKDSKYNVNFNVSERDSEGFRTLTINGKEYKKIKTQQLLLERIAKAILSYRTTTNNSVTKAGINHKEVGKILRDLKAKGWLKQGGTINLSLDEVIKDFINNNNI